MSTNFFNKWNLLLNEQDIKNIKSTLTQSLEYEFLNDSLASLMSKPLGTLFHQNNFIPCKEKISKDTEHQSRIINNQLYEYIYYHLSDDLKNELITITLNKYFSFSNRSISLGHWNEKLPYINSFISQKNNDKALQDIDKHFNMTEGSYLLYQDDNLKHLATNSTENTKDSLVYKNNANKALNLLDKLSIWDRDRMAQVLSQHKAQFLMCIAKLCFKTNSMRQYTSNNHIIDNHSVWLNTYSENLLKNKEFQTYLINECNQHCNAFKSFWGIDNLFLHLLKTINSNNDFIFLYPSIENCYSQYLKTISNKDCSSLIVKHFDELIKFHKALKPFGVPALSFFNIDLENNNLDFSSMSKTIKEISISFSFEEVLKTSSSILAISSEEFSNQISSLYKLKETSHGICQYFNVDVAYPFSFSFKFTLKDSYENIEEEQIHQISNYIIYEILSGHSIKEHDIDSKFESYIIHKKITTPSIKDTKKIKF